MAPSKTWGVGTYSEKKEKEKKQQEEIVPSGLGHGDRETKLAPTLVDPPLLQGARVGRYHRLPPTYALAFVMAIIPAWAALPSLFQMLMTWGKGMCVYVDVGGSGAGDSGGMWGVLEGRAGELEGIVWLLGGGMIDRRESM